MLESKPPKKSKGEKLISAEEFSVIKTKDELKKVLAKHGRNTKDVDFNIDYEKQLKNLQIELVKLQAWII